MTKPKPVVYTNLAESIKGVTGAHAAIHESIAKHAQEHAAAITKKRTALSMQHSAKKLMES
jgi:hypothetical protein